MKEAQNIFTIRTQIYIYIYIYIYNNYMYVQQIRKLSITFESLLTSASFIWSSTSLIPRFSLNYSRTYLCCISLVMSRYAADTVINE